MFTEALKWGIPQTLLKQAHLFASGKQTPRLHGQEGEADDLYSFNAEALPGFTSSWVCLSFDFKRPMVPGWLPTVLCPVCENLSYVWTKMSLSAFTWKNWNMGRRRKNLTKSQTRWYKITSNIWLNHICLWCFSARFYRPLEVKECVHGVVVVVCVWGGYLCACVCFYVCVVCVLECMCVRCVCAWVCPSVWWGVCAGMCVYVCGGGDVYLCVEGWAHLI